MLHATSFLGRIKVTNSKSPVICGVINLSPESFFKGSVLTEKKSLESAIEIMANNNAKIIDVGAQSTRPKSLYGGNEKISEQEELTRIKEFLPSVLEIATSYDLEVSVDTYRYVITDYALSKGVKIINDVTGLGHSPEIAKAVANFDASIVIMASKKLPGDINSVDEAITALQKSTKLAIQEGVKKDHIVIDPGFGGWQGRSWKIDRDIFQNLNRFKELGFPIYVGVSRKSTVGIPTGRKNPSERLAGTIALTTLLIEKEIAVIRTHDVPETNDTIKIVNSFV